MFAFHQGFRVGIKKLKVGKVFNFFWRTNRNVLDILAIRSQTIGFQDARPDSCFFYQSIQRLYYNDLIELPRSVDSSRSKSQQTVQRFGKLEIFQTPLAEQPVHFFHRAKRTWKWPIVFLLRWYFPYRLHSLWRGRHVGLCRYTCAIQREVRYFRTSNRISQGRCFPTAVHGERRRWVRGCNLYCGHMSQNLSTNHLNSGYSRLIKLQSFLAERLKPCEF